MDIKTIALILLVGRLIAVYFMALVIRRQRALAKLPIDPALKPFRKTLNRLSIVVLVGNLVPILIDSVTLLGIERYRWLGIVYAFSNCITAIAAAYLIWTLYKQAAKTVLIVDEATEKASHKKK